MIFSPENRSDIDRYYNNTYIKIKEHTNPDEVIYLHSVYKNCVVGKNKDKDEFKVWFYEDQPYSFDFILPRKSTYQAGKNACVLARIPAKQYKRGICNDNTSIIQVGPQGGLVPVEVSFDSVEAYVNKPKFFTLEEAVVNKQKYKSFALNSRMCYCVGIKTILLDSVPIAAVIGDTISTSLLFAEDMQEFAGGFKIEIK